MEDFNAPFLTRGTFGNNAGQSKNHKDLFYLTFARKLASKSPFQSKKHLKLRCLTGMWPAEYFYLTHLTQILIVQYRNHCNVQKALILALKHQKKYFPAIRFEL